MPTLVSHPIPGVTRYQCDAGVHGPVNSYAWDSPTGLILIDPAPGLTAQTLEGAPTRIAVTHVQAEHISGAAHFPDVPLSVPDGDAYLCAGEAAYRQSITKWEAPWDWSTRGAFRGHLAGARNERPPSEPLQVSEGSVPGLNVLPTPGHGKNAVTYLAEIEGRKVAFCGDLICGDGQLFNWFDAEWDYGLESGQKALLASARRLLAARPDLLLPAHGEPISDPIRALTTLTERLEAVLAVDPGPVEPLNFPEPPEIAPGWRQLSPHLCQWMTGNCALLVSKDGVGLVVDDGLCRWVPLEERREHHDAAFRAIKSALGLTRIEWALITHIHGDHTENIPDLMRADGTQVATLDVVGGPVESPERFNLASLLPWYGTAYDTVPVQRYLGNGETFWWREYAIETFHLGGQTYYHAGFTVKVDGQKVVFCGDAAFGWNTELEPVLCYNDCEPSERGWAYAIDRLLEQAPDLLVCGHGSAVRKPMPLLEAKRLAWQKRVRDFDALNPRASRALFFSPFLENAS